jgi:hypothetical protein
LTLLDSEPSGFTPGSAPGVLAYPVTFAIVVSHNQNSVVAGEVTILLAVNPTVIVEEVSINRHSGHDRFNGGDVGFNQVCAVKSMI